MGIVETVKYIAGEEGRDEGRYEGEEKKAREVVMNAIVSFGFSDEQAANVADVSVDFIKHVRSQIH